MRELPIREDGIKDAIRLSGICYDSLADGEGVRLALYFSGCDHHCPGCHNPDTHDFYSGEIITTEMLDQIVQEFNLRPYLSGITLTGGDPLYRPYQLEMIMMYLHTHANRDVNVWLYTGFLWEEIAHLPVISMVDVVVDGHYDISCADKRLQYKGSSNQRVIDAKRSIKENEVIIYGC